VRCKNLERKDGDAEVERECAQVGNSRPVIDRREVDEAMDQRDGKTDNREHIGEH